MERGKGSDRRIKREKQRQMRGKGKILAYDRRRRQRKG